MLKFVSIVGVALTTAASWTAPSPAAAQNAAANRPSFACNRASNAAERMICGDAELARLDRIVADLFAEVRSLSLNAEQRREIDAEQRAWLTRRNACRTMQCLRPGHFGRIAELAGQLPTDM